MRRDCSVTRNRLSRRTGRTTRLCSLPRLGPEVKAHERQLEDRVDRRDVEPSNRLQQGEPRLQALLRAHIRGAVAWDSRAPLRAGLRPSAVARAPNAADGVEDAEANLR